MSDPKRPAAQAAAVERWSLPDVGGPGLGRQSELRHGALSQAESMRASTREAEARGYQAGLDRAAAETQAQSAALAARIKQLDSILQLLQAPLRQLDGDIENELLQLALAVGKQLARRELRVDPAQVIGILRESLAQLPAAGRDVRISLHPEDANTVRERLPATGSERAWMIVEDPTLSRGGCLVRTETSQIDARFESRVNTIIASALGDERAPDRPIPESEA